MGHEAYVGEMAEGRDLPLLQDTAAADAWTSWAVTYRDVVILDADNLKVDVYNLTAHNLGDPARYAELKARLVAAIR